MSPTLENLKDKKKVKRMLTHYENMPTISSPSRRMKESKINEARLIPKIEIIKCEEKEEDEEN